MVRAPRAHLKRVQGPTVFLQMLFPRKRCVALLDVASSDVLWAAGGPR